MLIRFSALDLERHALLEIEKSTLRSSVAISPAKRSVTPMIFAHVAAATASFLLCVYLSVRE